MNVPHFIARRYAKSKKTRNVIHLISKISIIGIVVSTAALVVLLSAFNGIEQIVTKLYSNFDASLTIRSAKAKTFHQDFLDTLTIKSVSGVEHISRAIEEVVILQAEDKWVHAKMVGVDYAFLEMSKMDEHLFEGEPVLYKDNKPQALFGAYLLSKLDRYISGVSDFQETVIFNVPLRDGKIRPGKNPLKSKRIPVVGSMNFNREVNAEVVVIPYELANELVEYENDITALYVKIKDDAHLEKAKKEIQHIVGQDFEVKTNFEKNELIFKTSKTERLIVYFILLFIFILASFNLVASITMLFVEKKEDIFTLFSLGADRSFVFRIFFYEGLMIVGKGVVIGLGIGYLVIFAQLFLGFVGMPSVPGEIFPVQPLWKDAVSILISVSVLGFIVCYFPTKSLVGKYERLKT